jgi:phenylacetate-coenzyme A ligase PaaK-like adenylate-forming protein
MTNWKAKTRHARTFASVAWDARRAAKEGQWGIERRQRHRLQDLVAYARQQSAYLADRYRDLPSPLTDVRQLPVVTKAEMMSHFDDWVTDPDVKRKDVEAFIADPGLIGHDYLDRYLACTTSGTTGTPAIFLHDHDALTVYTALGYARSLPVTMSMAHIWALVRGKGRLAAVFVTGGHFLGNTTMARRHHAMPWRARTQRLFSALTPVAELVEDLNNFAPVMLSGYPSALDVLAREQRAGRLHIHPVVVTAAGETLTNAARQRIEAAFGQHVGNYYGSSEAVGLTFECAAKRMHVNTDWYILEPVDDHGDPVPAGQMSRRVLVTNLANRVQPIVRYQMGDRVVMTTGPCRCGSAFPQIEVTGRTDDILSFPTTAEHTVHVIPLAIATVAEETPGILSCQLTQTEPLKLMVRLLVEDQDHEAGIWEALRNRLTAYLSEQGATQVMIENAAEPPELHPLSGKFRQVYSQVKRQPL